MTPRSKQEEQRTSIFDESVQDGGFSGSGITDNDEFEEEVVVFTHFFVRLLTRS